MKQMLGGGGREGGRACGPSACLYCADCCLAFCPTVITNKFQIGGERKEGNKRFEINVESVKDMLGGEEGMGGGGSLQPVYIVPAACALSKLNSPNTHLKTTQYYKSLCYCVIS